MKNNKRSRNNTQNKASEDEFHSLQTPCCGLVHHVIQNEKNSVLSRLCQAWPCPPLTESRTLQEFLVYLANRSSCPDSHGATPQTGNIPSIRIQIQMEAIQKELACIKCVRCRSAAESALQETGLANSVLDLPQGDGSPTTFNLSADMAKIPPHKRYHIRNVYYNDHDDNHDDHDDSDLEYAQCYQRMEEGTQTHQQKPKMISLHSFVKNQETVSLILSQIVDEELIDVLVHHLLVPCGFQRDKYNLTSDQTDTIKQKIGHQSNHYTSALCEIRDGLETVEHRLSSYQPDPSTGFDVRNSKLLERSDAFCDDLLSKLIAVLLQITHEYHGLPSLESLQRHFERLWESYYETVQAVLQASCLLEKKMCQVASRQGVLRIMALDVGIRTSFYEMVSTRHRAITNFHRAIHRFLVDGDSYLQRRLTGYNAFYALVNKSPYQPTELDKICEKLVRAQEKLVSNVLPCSHVNQFPIKHHKRQSDLIEVMTKVNAAIVKEYPQVDSIQSDQLIQLKQEYTCISQHYRQELSKDEIDGDDDDMLGEHTARTRQTLTELSINLMTQWRCIRGLLIEKRAPTPVIPFALNQWIEYGDQWQDCMNCRNSGNRRIAGILGALLFQAISQICDEWYAELMQLELLKEIEPALIDEEPQKCKKKKKKKKKRKQGVSVETEQSGGPVDKIEQEDSPTEQLEQENMSIEEPSTPNKDPSSTPSTASTAASHIEIFDNGEWEVVGSKKLSLPDVKKGDVSDVQPSTNIIEKKDSKEIETAARVDTSSPVDSQKPDSENLFSDTIRLGKQERTEGKGQKKKKPQKAYESQDRHGNQMKDGDSTLQYSESNPQDVPSTTSDIVDLQKENTETKPFCSSTVSKRRNESNKNGKDDRNRKDTIDDVANNTTTADKDGHENNRLAPGDKPTNSKKKKKRSHKKSGKKNDKQTRGNSKAGMGMEHKVAPSNELASIGVIGPNGKFQSAEAFLIGRLENILDLKRKPHNGPPIIHL